MKVILTISLLVIFTSCLGTKNPAKEITSGSGLRYFVLKQGKGEPARKGQEVAIYESMGLQSGKQFYSISRPAPPIRFVLGEKQVIDGVDEGVTGMKAGEIRKLIVPPSLSKRKEYPEYLPKDSTLLYQVELVEIRYQ